MRLQVKLALPVLLAVVGAGALSQSIFSSLAANSAALVVAGAVSPGARSWPPPYWPPDAIWGRGSEGRRWEWEGRRALTEENLEAAIFALEQALRHDPHQPILRCLLGDAYDKAGRHADALTEWVQVGASFRLLGAGEAATQAERWDDGVAALSAAWDLSPANWKVVAAWTELYRAKGDDKGMEDVLRRAIAVDPEGPYSPERRLELAGILQRQGRWADAIAIYHDAITHAPTSVRARVKLGLALYTGEGRLAEALAEMDRALALAPDSAEPYVGKSQIYRAERRYEEALALAQRAAELAPSSIWPVVEQTNSLMGMGRASEAVSLLREAIETHPERAHLYYVLAYAYQQNGEREKAVVAAEQAVALDGDNVGFRLTAARMCEGASDVPGAIDAYTSVLALAPDNEQASEALQRLRDSEGNK